MKFSGFFVRRPVFTIMVALIVILIGVVSLLRLPIDLMPDISSPTLSISTSYEGAGPEEIEELISRPIEGAISAVPGVEEVTSTSSEGSSNVRVTFTWGTDLNAAADDIRERIDRIMNQLPEDADRPRLLKFDLSSFPIVILGAEGDLSPLRMRTFIDEQISHRIEQVPGVASLDILGGLNREIRVNLDANKIKALNLPFDTVLTQIRRNNIQIPAGQMETGNFDYTVRTPGELRSLKELENVVIAVRNNAPILLSEIAEIEDTSQDVTSIVRINGKPGIRLAVRKQAGTNTVEVASAVLTEIENINRDFRQIQLVPLVDTSKYIRLSIQNVLTSIVIGGVLSVFILLIFLRNLSTTLVIATAIPISIIATFSLMYFGNLTLNMMTLGGLALGVGMLVDNSIVVLENIYRLRDNGMEAEDAAIQGSSEVTAAIIASTLTTLGVFLPLIFVRGMSGIMFQQLAYVVSFSLVCSLVVSLTLVPMITARVLKYSRSKTSAFNEKQGGFSKVMESNYQEILSSTLYRRKTLLVTVTAALIGCIFLTRFIGTEFMPTADESEVRVNGEMQVGTKLEVVEENFRKLEEIIIKEVPEATNIQAEIGGGWRSNSSHRGEFRVFLKPKSERTRSSEQVADDLRKKLTGIPGMVVRTRAGQGLFIFRIVSGGNTDRIQVEIRGYDFETGMKLASDVQKKIEEVPGITDTRVSREEGSPEEVVVVDRLKAADMNLTVSDVAGVLRTILSGSQAGNYREGGKEYRILVKVKDSEQMQMQDLLNLTMSNPQGESVILSSLVKTESRNSPVSIQRQDQERIINVSADVSDRDMNEVLNEIRAEVSKMTLPRGFSVSMGGDFEEQQKSNRDLLFSFILSLILVYMIMAAQYESYIQPFVIMFSVPLAAIGVILMLILSETTFNVQTFIGTIMLGGIVVNNAIILVDQINLLRRDYGLPLREAVEEAGRRRLRPILMTTLTTVLGLVPLALGIGEGSETQAPMARTVIGGLLSSTIFTLLVVPVLYYTFENLRDRVKKVPLKPVHEEETAEAV